MFIIVTPDREVVSVWTERPDARSVPDGWYSLYATKAETAGVTLPVESWIPSPGDPGTVHLVRTPGTILTPNQLTALITRQDAIKAQVQGALTFAQTITGRTFDSLTTAELKNCLRLLFATHGWIDQTGAIDLSDFGVDDLMRVRAR